jgi:pimeloyl-ACP methyl ester carboxylesterase
MAPTIAAFITALGLKRVNVVAHSSGAHAALFFAAAHPEMIRTLAINEPPAAGLLIEFTRGRNRDRRRFFLRAWRRPRSVFARAISRRLFDCSQTASVARDLRSSIGSGARHDARQRLVPRRRRDGVAIAPGLQIATWPGKSRRRLSSRKARAARCSSTGSPTNYSVAFLYAQRVAIDASHTVPERKSAGIRRSGAGFLAREEKN